MRVKDFYIRVSQVADTEGTSINAAEVSRVLGVARRAARDLPFLSRLALAARFFFGKVKSS